MLRLASDADVRNGIIRGLRRRVPEIDLLRAQDALPEGTSDPEILAWAAAEDRVLITNDRETMIGFAYERLASGDPLPGIILTTNEQSMMRYDVVEGTHTKVLAGELPTYGARACWLPWSILRSPQ